ncbi:MAG: hypothetical protein MUC49_08480 [Raineya sp.]|jgi:hypothetical protein|nr:hypothetical protein [Raineya sp.]
MLTGLKILIFSMLLGGNKNISPTPYIISKVEFLGFFGENKYCYYRNSLIQKRGNGWFEEIQEFVVKDFNGKEILREVVKREEEFPSNYPQSTIKTKYLGRTNIWDFLKNNNVQKRNKYESSDLGIKKNNIYWNRNKYSLNTTKDSVNILDSSKVRKNITQHNKEPIFVEYEKNEWQSITKLGDWEKDVYCSNIKDVYSWKQKYLLILNNYKGSDEYIILVDASILDKVFKR